MLRSWYFVMWSQVVMIEVSASICQDIGTKCRFLRAMVVAQVKWKERKRRTQIGIIGFAEIRRDAKGRVCPSTWHWPYHLQASAAPCSAKLLCCWAFFHDWTSCLHVSYRWHTSRLESRRCGRFNGRRRRPGHPAMKPFLQWRGSKEPV